jgi:hypothetical protein
LCTRSRADRSLELLVVFDRRQLQDPQRDLLARDPEADALRQVVLLEEGLHAVGEPVDVDDLPLVEEARAEALRRGPHQLRLPVAAELGGRQEAGLDVEPNDRTRS